MGALWWLIKTAFKLCLILTLIPVVLAYGYYLYGRNENIAYYADQGYIHVPSPKGEWCSVEGTFRGFYEQLDTPEAIVFFPFACAHPSAKEEPGKHIYQALVIQPSDTRACAGLNPKPLNLPNLNNSLIYCTVPKKEYPSGNVYIFNYELQPNKYVNLIVDSNIIMPRREELAAIINSIELHSPIQ